MKRSISLAWIGIILIFLGSLSLPSCSQEKDSIVNYSEKETIRLTICYPSPGSLKALINLKEKGLLPLPNLSVHGVYHYREKTNYEASRRFLQENQIEWITLEEIQGDLSPDVLYQKNELTPIYRRIFQESDGLIFFGGPDIPPLLYQKPTLLLTRIVDPYRHYFELSLIFHLLGGSQNPDWPAFLKEDPEFPILGICLGAQSLNVGTGGTLFQDIWLEIYSQKFFEDVINLGRENWHTNPWARLHPELKLFPYFLHPITWEKDSFFEKRLGFPRQPAPYIMSAHHQAVNKLGQGFRVAATSLDGKVVEAITHQEYPNVIGLQFHPEFPILYDESQNFQFTPEDESPVNLPDFLRRHFPSQQFHQKIWSWWADTLTKSHQRPQKININQQEK
jgi:putative glutamine amidotransferase